VHSLELSVRVNAGGARNAGKTRNSKSYSSTVRGFTKKPSCDTVVIMCVYYKRVGSCETGTAVFEVYVESIEFWNEGYYIDMTLLTYGTVTYGSS
jgi:hypothetical protein